MFKKLFQKAQKVQESAVQVLTPTPTQQIIEQIHHEFEMAAENVLIESKQILENIVIENKDKAERAKVLGFSNLPDVKNLNEVEFKKKEAEEKAKLITEVQSRYPLHKFITEYLVKQICEKYNLVFGEASLYKGFLPEKNLKEIEAFVKWHPEMYYEKNRWSGSSSLGRNNVTYKYLSKDEYERKCSEAYTYSYLDFFIRHTQWGSVSYHKGNLPLMICAPQKDMDMTNKTLNGHKIVNHIPDPVVLFPIKEGYIIVTAWGDEASDPIVTNPINN